MKRFLNIMAVCSLAVMSLWADFSERPRDNIGLNLAGDASLLALDYERIFDINDHIFITGKAGLGYNEEFQLCLFGPCSEPPEQYVNVNLHVTGNYGAGRHFLEAGFGATMAMGSAGSHYPIVYPILGYRLHPLYANKIYFRAFVCYPVLGMKNIDFLYAPFGIVVGFSF